LLRDNNSEGKGGNNGKAQVGFYHHFVQVIKSRITAGIDIFWLYQAPCITPCCSFVYSIVGKSIAVVLADHFCSAATLSDQYNPNQYGSGYPEDPFQFNPVCQTVHMHLFKSKKKMPACFYGSAKETVAVCNFKDKTTG
jgi:hypothetical protein